MTGLTGFISFLFIIGVVSGAYPEGLPKCKYGDTECIANAISVIGKTHAGGNRGLHLIPIDPLQIKSLEISQSPSSPVNVQLKFKDAKLLGISEAKAYNVVGFGEDPANSEFGFNVKVPKLTLVGPYDVKGRVLILPITGNGNSALQFDNVDCKIKFVTNVEEKNGEKHLSVNKIKLDFTTSRMHVKLENLFNGDKTLGDNMNNFLNENWNDIFQELKPGIINAISEILRTVIQQPFAKFPYKDLFEH